MFEVSDDLVHSNLKTVTLRESADKLIAQNIDADQANKLLLKEWERWRSLTASTDLESVKLIKNEKLKGRPIFFQFISQFEKGTDSLNRTEIVKRYNKTKKANLIALVCPFKGNYRPYDPKKDGYIEKMENGRKVIYFRVGTKSATIYFIDRAEKTIIGKQNISAGNSSQTTDVAKDLIVNFYGGIEKLETELGAIKR